MNSFAAAALRAPRRAVGRSLAGWRNRFDSNKLRMATFSAIAVTVLTSVLTLAYLRSQAEARTAVTAQNLARSLVLTFEGILDSMDIAMLAASDEIARQAAAGQASQQDINHFLGKQQSRLPVASTLRATDAAGTIIYGAGLQAPYASVANVYSFMELRDLRDVAESELYVSPPSVDRISQKWMWQFARRIALADGAFAGVVYGGLDIDQIRSIMARIELGAGGSIVLRHASFEGIAGRMGAAAAFPLKPGDKALSPELLAALKRDPQRGTYTTSRSFLSDAAHSFSYQRSSKYGFYVWVGEANAVALAEWHRQVWIIAGLAAAFTALAAGFLLLMGRAWRRQERDRAAIRESRLSLREAQEIADIGSLTYDFTSKTWTSSGIFDRIVGIGPNYPRDRRSMLRFLERKDWIALRRYVNSAFLRTLPFDDEQLGVRRLDGQRRWLHLRGKVCVNADLGQTFVCSVQDVTARKQAESDIRRLAYYDVLTDLPNRRLLLDRLAATMSSNAVRARQGALLMIDLDNFKILNDTQGHNRGDLLLKRVAERLLTCVRTTDTVARLGGDEFVVLIEDLAGDTGEARRQAAAAGEKLRAALTLSFDLEGYQYASTPSIGITLFAGFELSTDELTKRADTAMYQAKAAGRNTVRFFDPEMQAAVAARLALESDLRQAIVEQQFVLHYQVQVAADGRVTGAEVLVRWQHRLRGMVSPAEFIPLAEASGAILPLGSWVLETACAQLAAWSRVPAMAELNLAVNVSARQFSQPDFVGQVLAVLERTGANPRRLKLELTEGLLLEHTEAVIATIGALKRVGVGFSLDDFGTGYSSLSYLKRLPLDQLKIDQSFVRDLLTDANDIAIVRTIVALGQSLGMEVIAEGVETEQQRACLALAGCFTYQGYLYGRPLPLQAFEQSLRLLAHTKQQEAA